MKCYCDDCGRRTEGIYLEDRQEYVCSECGGLINGFVERDDFPEDIKIEG